MVELRTSLAVRCTCDRFYSTGKCVEGSFTSQHKPTFTRVRVLPTLSVRHKLRYRLCS